MTLRHLLERGGGPGLLLPVLALFLSSRQVDSLYLQDCRWTVNQTLGRDLCVQPDAEFAESGMLADFAYPIYHRQARALSSGHFNRARFLVRSFRRNGIVTGPSVQRLFPPLNRQPLQAPHTFWRTAWCTPGQEDELLVAQGPFESFRGYQKGSKMP